MAEIIPSFGKNLRTDRKKRRPVIEGLRDLWKFIINSIGMSVLKSGVKVAGVGYGTPDSDSSAPIFSAASPIR